MDFDFEFDSTDEYAPLPPASADSSSIFLAPLAAPTTKGFTANAEGQPLEGGTDPAYGSVLWRTLISGDRTPSSDLVLGIAEMTSFGTLHLHRHEPPEFYLGLSGDGIVEIDGTHHRIAAGVAVFVPGNAEHGVTAGADGLSFAFGFAKNSFADVDYAFSGCRD